MIELKDLENKKIISEFKNDENAFAALTHYIHHAENEDIAANYRVKAYKTIEKLFELKYSQQELTNDLKERIVQNLITEQQENIVFPGNEVPSFTFIDLFAGIGGFRMAMQNLGGKCLYTSEWDKYSKKSYSRNYGEIPFGDITNDDTKAYIPDNFDVLCAGFPCQAFSIAGKKGGFEDTRGTLFFEVAEIIRTHRPRAIFLENVKGLRGHDKGKTLATILNVLRNDLGYFIPNPDIINAKYFGVPQNRERIFIVGFINEEEARNFSYPEQNDEVLPIESILEKDVVSVKYYLSTQYFDTLKKHRQRHEGKGNGFGYQVIPNDGIANAVVCGGMGRERNLVFDDRLTDFKPVTKIKSEVNREGIRKMTPREWARLQGFPDNFKITVSDVQAYKQFGNSVAVPAIQATAQAILDSIPEFQEVLQQ